MNLIPKIRLSVVMDADRSINRNRVGFSQMVVPFGIRWHGVINSSIFDGAAFDVVLAWLFCSFTAGGRRMGSFFIACLRWKTGKKWGKAGD